MRNTYNIPCSFQSLSLSDKSSNSCFIFLGSEDLFQKFKVPVGGDQLSRVRLEEAKNLRSLATTRKKRFENLDPIIIEFWHMKQDFLEVFKV